MDARKKNKVESLTLAEGQYSISISQRGDNYVVNLEKAEKTQPKLEILRDEKRGPGRPRRNTPVMEIPKEVSKRKNKQPQLKILKDDAPKRRGRPPKVKMVEQPVKRGRGRPKKTA